MAFYLTVEQGNFSSEDLPLNSLIDSLSSVVDANVDFNSSITMHNSDDTVQSNGDSFSVNVIEGWKSEENEAVVNNNNSEVRSPSMNKTTECCKGSNANQFLKSSFENNNEAPHATLGNNYPAIPLPVAQYINETNPGWCAEAEKYLQLAEISKWSSQNNSHASLDSPISPFRSMAATTEALALQNSVIGNKAVKPVSPDVVAEVVARTQLRFQQQTMNTSTSQHSVYKNNSGASDEQHVNVSGVNSYAMPTMPNERNIYIGSKVPMLSSSKDYIINESRRSSISSISSICSKKGNRFASSDIPSVHASQRSRKLPKTEYSTPASKSQQNLHSDYIVDSETESCFSEKLELESVCSDAFETESNISEVSGFGEELTQVKRLLEQIANSEVTGNHTCDGVGLPESSAMLPTDKSLSNEKKDQEQSPKKEQLTQTESSELLDIMRAKANLEGQLECVTKSEIDLNKECTSLHATVTSLQSQVDTLKKQCDRTVMEKQSVLKKVEFLNEQQGKWDNVLKEYQNIVENKNSEIKGLKEDISEAEQANIQAKIGFEELKMDIESKDAAVSGLKKKIAELHCEVQLLLQSGVQYQNDVKNAKREMESLEKSRDWYKDQLYAAQKSRDQLHKDLISLQSNQVTVSNNFEKSKTEVSHLKQQLCEIQQRAVGEKEVLMKHLENIEADMMERESLFDEIQKDKGSVENLLLDKAKRMEEERSKITHLSFTVSDLEYQLSIVKSDIFEKDKSIYALEKEKAELCKQVALLQKTVSDKDFSVQQLMQNLKDANSKLSHQDLAAKSVEALLETLKSEKNAAEMALASLTEEKRTNNESLKVLKENLHRFESTLKHMKAELVSKTSKIDLLTKEKTSLEESFRKLEEETMGDQKNFEQEIFKKNQNHSVIIDDLKKQKLDLENVLEVYRTDLLTFQQKVKVVEHEKNELRNEVCKFQNHNHELINKSQICEAEKDGLQKEVHKLLEMKMSPVHPQGIVQKDSASENDITINDPFLKIKKEYLRKIRIYKSNIKILSRNLKEKLQQCESLNKEVKALKEAKAVVPASNSSELTSLQNELHSEKANSNQLENELKSLRESIRQEQERVEKNHEIIIELEKEKGKISAICSSNEALKLQISQLEAEIAEKESLSSQLRSQLEVSGMEFQEQYTSVQGKLSSLEEEMKKEKILIKGLRQQIFQEKRTNSHLNRQLASLKTGLELANQTAESKKKDVSSLQSELDLNLQVELKNRESTKLLQSQIQSYQSEIEKLKKEISEVNTRDPVLAEQLKSLSWHLKEKKNEIAAHNEKQTLLEERHQMEVEGLKKSHQNLQGDLEKCKSELEEVRKQKFHFHSQLVQLRKAFKANLMNADSGESATSNSLSFDTESSFDESYINNLLQKSLLLPESRPLNHLQTCLNSLKQEMAELQKQIRENVETTL